jgi:hypothetical protein
MISGMWGASVVAALRAALRNVGGTSGAEQDFEP